MDRDDTPCTLDEELHEEAGGREVAFAVRHNPGGDEHAGDEGGDNDGAATADELGEVTDDGAADAGADLHHDGGAGGLGVVELLLGEHEGGVGVLGGVGVDWDMLAFCPEKA